MTVKHFKPTVAHITFRKECMVLLDKHAGHMDSSEMLAMAAHMVGQIVALQDQRRFTSEQIMELVGHNIEQGNLEVINAVNKSQGRG